MTQHSSTTLLVSQLSALLLTLTTIASLVVLTYTGDVSGEISVPIIASLAGVGVGASAQKALNGQGK